MAEKGKSSSFLHSFIHSFSLSLSLFLSLPLVINMGEAQLDVLQRAQNKAMRVILHSDRHTKIERMLHVLQFIYIIMYAYLFISY